MVIAECSQGCDDALVTNYHFSVFKEWDSLSNDSQSSNWIECISNESSIKYQ